MVLYDLQNALANIETGALVHSGCIKPFGSTPPTVMIENTNGGKRLKITGRRVREDGISLLLPEIQGLHPGDRLTITGHVGEGAPNTNDWGLCLRSPRGEFNQLTQVIAPQGLFTLSYVIDKTDFGYPLYVHANTWGGAKIDMDFYIDNMTISRADNIHARADTRQLIYSMETDGYMSSYRSGDILMADPDSPLSPSGACTCIVRRGAITVSGRKNDWDGLDIKLDTLGLMPGNSYNIHVVGRVEGAAPPETQIMLQIIPGYAWRDNHIIYSQQDFTLGHTLTLMELETADTLRITTNSVGAAVDFTIYSVEITTENWSPFVF